MVRYVQLVSDDQASARAGGPLPDAASRGSASTAASAGPTSQLVAISFDDDLKAAEFMTALTRLARNKNIVIRDAVFVVKDADNRTHVRETRDIDPRGAALGGALWAALIGGFVGGPIGLIAGGALGAGAGALTAKLVDLGISDAFVDQVRNMVRPGTTTLAVLVDHFESVPVEDELKRFVGARYVTGNLPLEAIERIRADLDDPSPTTGGGFSPPHPDDVDKYPGE